MSLRKVRTRSHFIPVADCPKCKLKDTPLSEDRYVFTHKDTGKKVDACFISCPKCGWLANFDEKSWSHVKGYLSIKDLEDLGYTKEVTK